MPRFIVDEGDGRMSVFSTVVMATTFEGTREEVAEALDLPLDAKERKAFFAKHGVEDGFPGSLDNPLVPESDDWYMFTGGAG